LRSSAQNLIVTASSVKYVQDNQNNTRLAWIEVSATTVQVGIVVEEEGLRYANAVSDGITTVATLNDSGGPTILTLLAEAERLTTLSETIS
jgi:hypothetical protein